MLLGMADSKVVQLTAYVDRDLSKRLTERQEIDGRTTSDVVRLGVRAVVGDLGPGWRYIPGQGLMYSAAWLNDNLDPAA